MDAKSLLATTAAAANDGAAPKPPVNQIPRLMDPGPQPVHAGKDVAVAATH